MIKKIIPFVRKISMTSLFFHFTILLPNLIVIVDYGCITVFHCILFGPTHVAGSENITLSLV